MNTAGQFVSLVPGHQIAPHSLPSLLSLGLYPQLFHCKEGPFRGILFNFLPPYKACLLLSLLRSPRPGQLQPSPHQYCTTSAGSFLSATLSSQQTSRHVPLQLRLFLPSHHTSSLTPLPTPLGSSPGQSGSLQAQLLEEQWALCFLGKAGEMERKSRPLSELHHEEIS